MPKHTLDDLNLKGQDLGPKEEDLFDEELPQIDLSKLKIKDLKSTMPRHLMRRSLTKEQDMWNYNILPSAKDRLGLRVGTKERAKVIRTRLYHARTYLQQVNKAQYGPVFEDPLDNWSLSLEELEGAWYIIALNCKLEEGWVEL